MLYVQTVGYLVYQMSELNYNSLMH